jgi:ubiquinone/menaquinone biosynthesis C-methylase UbiE
MRKSLEIYSFQKDEVIASIGAGGGVWEIGFATFHEDLTFYLQDINGNILNQADIDYAIEYYTKVSGKPNGNKFIPVIGTETKTNLPTNTFDKVLIINSFHEFDNPINMLAEVRRILKQGGKLFIEETLARELGQLHDGCKKPLYLEQDLLAFLDQHGFTLDYSRGREVETGESFWKIFVFVPKQSEQS